MHVHWIEVGTGDEEGHVRSEGMESYDLRGSIDRKLIETEKII